MNNLRQIFADVVGVEQTDLFVDAPFCIVNVAVERVNLEGAGQVAPVVVESALQRAPAMVEDVTALLDDAGVTAALAHQFIRKCVDGFDARFIETHVRTNVVQFPL